MSGCCKIYNTGSRPKGAYGIQSLALEDTSRVLHLLDGL
jgi:hypothetical protein